MTMPEEMNSKSTDLMATGFGGAEPTMSTMEIADLTGKRHDHVMRDTRKMLEELHGAEAAPNFGGSYLGQDNTRRPCFDLPKRETLILVSGYNIGMRAKIIDRWQELEAKPQADPIAILNDPAAMRGILLSYTEKVLELQGEVEEMRPQVQALERIAVSDGSLCITDAAKTLQVQPKNLFAFLKAHGWIYTRQGDNAYIAYQAKLQTGLLEHKTTAVTKSDGSEKITTQVRVTPKGLTRLAREFQPVARAA